MKEISIIAKLANIKDIEDLVKIEQDRGEDFVEDLEECKDNIDI